MYVKQKRYLTLINRYIRLKKKNSWNKFLQVQLKCVLSAVEVFLVTVFMCGY